MLCERSYLFLLHINKLRIFVEIARRGNGAYTDIIHHFTLQSSRNAARTPNIERIAQEAEYCLDAFPVYCTATPGVDDEPPKPVLTPPFEPTASVLVPTTTSVPPAA